MGNAHSLLIATLVMPSVIRDWFTPVHSTLAQENLQRSDYFTRENHQSDGSICPDKGSDNANDTSTDFPH
jgi:carbamate kinase